jgi:hypothetical protein
MDPLENNSTKLQSLRKCREALLSIEGLRAVKAPEGYKHYNRKELDVHAKSGCKLCTYLNQPWLTTTDLIADSEPAWTFFACESEDFLQSDKRIKTWKAEGNSTPPEHPLCSENLKHLGAENKAAVIWFKVVAEEGMSAA